MPKIDEKQKKLFLEKIYQDYPEVQADSLKHYCVEKLLEAYLLDPSSFVKKTDELMKKEKKKLKKEDTVDENTPKKNGGNPEIKEIIAISKIAAEETEPKKEITITEDGMIKAV